MTLGARRRRAVAAIAVLVVAAAAAILLMQGIGFGRRPTSSGIVVAVESSSAVDITGFELRTPSGSVEHYAVGRLETDGKAFPAVHLRSHLVSLLPIGVTYETVDGVRVAIRLEDAPLPLRS